MKIDSNKLKGARVTKGKTQADVAKLLNIDNTTYAKKENGDSEFRLREAYLIAEFLEADVLEIFSFIRPDQNAS